ncbi:MAG: hydroxymethylbilane synthase [Gemmatimonadota bacterium]|nr:MAG: hydroxymethylbilane synthase [Gemmatimonadota bacterium]
MTTVLKLGSRGSKLALIQSRTVATAVEGVGTARVEVEIIQTTGDSVQDRPLPEIGGKGLFTQELDSALMEGRIQFAVHSLKDLPTDMDPRLCVAATSERLDPRDVIAGPAGSHTTLAGLPTGAILGTSSLRRAALARAFRPDLDVRDIRGNVDTRLAKVDAGEYDAVVLAGAGLVRLGLEERVGEWMERTSWLPAPAQGALGIVTRTDDEETRALLEPLRHPETEMAVTAERALLAALGGGCHVPVGALGLTYADGLRLWGLVASPDGRHLVRSDITGSAHDPAGLGRRTAQTLIERGAGELLEATQADIG